MTKFNTTYKTILEAYKFTKEEADNEQILIDLRPKFAEAAQEVYDNWDESDDTYGGGGICHLIADAILDVVYKNTKAQAKTISYDHEIHVACLVAFFDEENPPEDTFTVYTIDVPWRKYETHNGGYSFNKKNDIKFKPTDVTIESHERITFEDWNSDL